MSDSLELKYSTSGLLARFCATLSTMYRMFNRELPLFTRNIDFKKVDELDMKYATDCDYHNTYNIYIYIYWINDLNIKNCRYRSSHRN